ncbi:tetratricopeptide repeat protein [Marinoscillum sp.]|uniref:tetratricopeptide repeat protein n=1 Tax=Marinoscillum sp. TaxID=2024838 RepID=UPI003BAC690C
MKRFTLICICLSGCFIGNAQLSGDSLYESGQYFQAAVAYEKEAFFASSAEVRDELLLKKAYSYKALGNYSKAFDITSRIGKRNDSLNRQVLYERILLTYLSEEYQKAQNELLKWQVKYGEQSEETIPLKFLTLVQIDRLEEAKEFLNANASTLEMEQQEVDSFFEKKWKLKNPDKAYMLSLFLPGVGQMYAGHFFKGMFSGVVQTGLVVFTAWNVYNGYFFTGGMTGAALFYTFYLGGARYARNLTIEYNDQVKSKISSKFLQTVTK